MPEHSLSLPFWEGFTATKLDVLDDAIWITLCRDPAAAMVCGRCGAHCYQVHDVATRTIRELPMQGKPVRLRVPPAPPEVQRVRDQDGTRDLA